MAGTVMLNAKVFIGGYNFSGIHNSIALEYGAEMLDETVFQAGVNTNTRKNKAGLKTFSFSGNVFWNDEVDGVIFSRVGGQREVMMFANTGEVEGDVVFITRGITYTYNPLSGEIGQLLQATLSGNNSNQELVRGRLMKGGTIVASGSSAGLNLGSAAGKKLVSSLHLTSPAPTMGSPANNVVVTIESAPDSGFAAPTVRLTHTTLHEAAASWQEIQLDPGVTDAYWRATWTLSGAGPFDVSVNFGWVV